MEGRGPPEPRGPADPKDEGVVEGDSVWTEGAPRGYEDRDVGVKLRVRVSPYLEVPVTLCLATQVRVCLESRLPPFRLHVRVHVRVLLAHPCVDVFPTVRGVGSVRKRSDVRPGVVGGPADECDALISLRRPPEVVPCHLGIHVVVGRGVVDPSGPLGDFLLYL